jgi:RNA polymerase-binding transcription factor DksA
MATKAPTTPKTTSAPRRARAAKDTTALKGTSKAAPRKGAVVATSHGLSAAELAELEALLVDELRLARRSADASTMSLIDQLGSGEPLGGDAVDGSIDIGIAETAAFTANRAHSEVHRLIQALHRLRHAPQDFGRCTVCREPIGFPRLEALPTATTCMRHARG